MSDVLDTLVVKLTAELDTLRRDLRTAQQETERAGDLASKSFGGAFKRQSMGDLFNKQEFGKQGRDVGQQAGREAARGFDQSFQQHAQQATAGTAGLGTQFMALRGSIQAAVAAAAAWTGSQMVQQLVGLAKEAQAAENAQMAFERSVRRAGLSVQEANGLIAQLADKYGASSVAAQKSAETLIRNGASLQQVQQAFTAVGASAAREGKNIGEAWDAVSTALVTGRSELLESYGLVTNLGPVYQKYAKSIGTVSDNLTSQQRITAGLNAILKETSSEIQDQDIYLQGLTRSENENLKAKSDLRKEIGDALKPAVSALMDEQTRALKSALDWAKANRDTLETAIRVVATAVVDATGAIRVLLGLMADVGKAAGGLGTVLVGFGLTVAGGLTGGINAALTEIKRLFTSSLNQLAALQQAWDKLKSGDFGGARQIVQESIGATMEALRAAPGNILAGASGGAQWGLEAMRAGAEDIAAFGSATTAAAAAADAASTRIRGALDGLVQGQELVNALGLGGRRRGAAYGNRYLNGNYIHNGEDYFAPTGTPLYAPFTGQLTTRYSKTTGNIVEMLDAAGNKILLGHLDRFAAGLQEAIKRAGGKLMVQGGTLVGYVGETGTMANIMGAKNNDHAHIMAYNAQGKIIDPLKAQFRGFDAPNAWSGPDRLVQANARIPYPTDLEGPITAAQIVKAQQLLDAVEKAKKAMQAKPGDNGLKIAYDAASQALANWTKESKENARAAQAVRDSQTGAAKSASGAYIATAADLRKWGSDALRLTKDLDKARASGSAQAIATAERNMQAWLGESEVKKAVLAAETAAYRARQQQAEDARRQAERDGAPAKTQAEIRAQEKLEKALRNASRARLEQLANGTVGENGLTLEKWKAARAEIERRDRAAEQSRARDKAEDEKAAKEAEARAKEAAQRRARVAEEARQGSITLAKQEAERLEQMRDNDLRKAGDSAKKRREVELRYANDIYLAKKAIAEREYKDAMGDAARGPAQNRAQAELIAKRNLDAALAKAEAEKNTRLTAARKAEEAEDKAAKDRAAAREKEQAQLRARIADERRKLTESAARQELGRVQELNKQELAAFKGTGTERLALVKRQAEDEYQARLAVARATRDRLLKESAIQRGPNQAERDRQIRADYAQAELQARGQRDAAVRQAQEQQTRAVRELRAEYSKLAEGIRAQVAAGEFGADQQREATARFNELGRAAKAAGLDTNKHIELARKSVWGLITTGADLSTTLNLIASGVARVGENGELLYATDDELRGIGVAAEDAAEDFFDLQNAIDGVGMLSRDELGTLIEQAGLAEEAAEALWAAWNRVNEGLTGGPIELPDNLAGRGIQNEPDAFDPATGNMAEGEAESLARAFWGQPIEELRAVFASLSQKDTPLGNLLQGAIKAQELLSRLEIAADPVEIQGITAEIAEFMASDMGKALPPTISGALEAGVRDADSYREILASATAEGVRDGFDRAAGADTVPQNRFAELSETLWSMGDALKDPATLEAVTGELERARAAGELTNTELALLKQIIDSINGTPIEIGLTDDERRFEEVSERANRIVADFEAGAISAEEFASQLGPVTHQMERMAAMAEAQGKHDLAALYRDIAAGLRNMIPPLAQATEEVATLGQGLDDLGRGFASVLDAFGLSEWGKLSSAAAGLFKTFEQGRTALSAIGPAFSKSFGAGLSAVGAFLGVVSTGINLIGQIGDAILNLSPGFRAWKKNLLEVAEAQKKVASESVGMFKNPYSAGLLEDAAKRENLANAGFWKRVWWGISGTAPKVLSDEAAKLQIKAAEIFGELGQTISGAIESGLMNAFETGDWTGVGAAFEKSLNTLVAKMALQAILASSQMEAKLKAYSDARAEAMKDGSISADEQKQLDEYMAGIRAEYQSIQESWKATAPGLPGYGQGAGPAGSIAALQGEISKLQQQLSLATTDAERERLRSEIEAKQKELARLSGEAEAAQGSIAALQNRISALQAEYNATTSQAERDRLRAEIEGLQRSLGVMNGEGLTELTAPSLKTVKVDMPASIASTINFDVMATLSSSALSLAQQIPYFGTYVGQFGAITERWERMTRRAEETNWGALR